LKTKIHKILIANRGEIAVRIIRACREMGIISVAVYSEVDKTAMHVREADEAYHIGEAQASESYLRHDVIIDTAKKSCCDAIHPGYGFMAENAEFATTCRKEGFIFIGPSSDSITLLGDKIASRKMMSAAGVPVIPGVDDADLSDKQLFEAAERIGYPVMIKAAGGGGGKGMRAVQSADKFMDSIQAARREAQSAFGNPTVFLEKFLVKPRHIEFQIFSDQHCNHVHLFERECSIQRRHQKIIEECPSPAMNEDLRKNMGDTAVQVAKAANYENAGTVEFLLDENDKYFFLEVNTRIQVEHPITEEITGTDLVIEQIRVASGERLSWKQDDITTRGHAVECRIYAEDATVGFLPSTGKIHRFYNPTGLGIRIDSGIETGDEVSMYYDPILAKIVAYGKDRDSAIQRMRQALTDTVVLGVTTNIDFMKDVLDRKEFIDGKLHINFIEEYMPDWKPAELSNDQLNVVLGLATIAKDTSKQTYSESDTRGQPEPWQVVGAWEIGYGQ
jgi:acetyl-CoA carboxylase biotin carboxylase subunit